ncbi:MAG TPA: hypothetical protein VKC90_14035 [Chitinophagaceae bacterium]|nr:hypothetical protein [Chitinophagaceae bacterium]
MKKLWISFGLISLMACTKQKQLNDSRSTTIKIDEQITAKGGPPKQTTYTTYTIRQGQHYCDQSGIKSVRTSEMKFIAKFDNSAIYQTIDPQNQYDVNKLWGFSEGIDNQYNSARIGWSWNNDTLRLYAYVHVNGVMQFQEITPVALDTDINCSIKVSGNSYIFTVNSNTVTMPRGLSTTQASGYQQYPYFGGDETAPHLITILIKSL